MLSTELSTILASIGVLIAGLAWLYAVKCWNFCRETEEYLKKKAKDPSPSMATLTQLECEMTELADSVAALHVSLRKLRARIGMRENRAAKGSTDSQIPDSTKDPAGYKRYMRLKLNGNLQK